MGIGAMIVTGTVETIGTDAMTGGIAAAVVADGDNCRLWNLLGAGTIVDDVILCVHNIAVHSPRHRRLTRSTREVHKRLLSAASFYNFAENCRECFGELTRLSHG